MIKGRFGNDLAATLESFGRCSHSVNKVGECQILKLDVPDLQNERAIGPCNMLIGLLCIFLEHLVLLGSCRLNREGQRQDILCSVEIPNDAGRHTVHCKKEAIGLRTTRHDCQVNLLCKKTILSCAAVKGVLSAEGADPVIPAIAGQNIVSEGADQKVVTGAAVKLVIPSFQQR